jgi:hypothetical protein
MSFKKFACIFLCSAVGILWMVLFPSCTSVKTSRLHLQLEKSICNQQNAYNYLPEEMPQPFHLLELDTLLTSRFDFKSLNVAHAIGILDLLKEYVSEKQHYRQTPTIENKLNVLELSQKLHQRINISSLEISAIASEIDCEEERADQIASYLIGKENETETKLTVGAIVIGAAGAIASGIVVWNRDAGGTPEFIGMGTGFTEAILGTLILVNKRKTEFYHPRNALREIWHGHETSTIFPSSVWYYLNYYNAQTGTPSLRYQIIEKWMSFGQISEANTRQRRQLIDIYFDDGGKYTADQLVNRSNMLDQLEAYILLMKQDLKGLALELENLK